VARVRGVFGDQVAVLHSGLSDGERADAWRALRRGDRRVAVEDPSLDGLFRRVEAAGLDRVACRVDRRGVVVAGARADAAIVTPAHQFPTGAVLGGERRRALLSWAAAGGRLVIEDDYDAEFRYDREPAMSLQGLDPDRVAYLGSASKTLAPALRLGWLVVPAGLADEAAEAKRLLDFCTPVLDQLALRRLLEAGDYDRHVRRVRAVYRARRDRLAGALAERLPAVTVEGIAAGLHVLLRLPPGADDARVAAAAEREGVHVEPLSRYAVQRPQPPGLVVGYGRIRESALEPAAAALAAAVARC
jgi:GntR family transcriptional regulator/MocR family aminotransferase